MNLSNLTFKKIKDEISYELTRIYKKAGELFSSASPHGQIMTAVSAIFDLHNKYIENVTQEVNLKTAANKNSIRGLSRIIGHDPQRALSASGMLRFRLKAGVNINEEILGGRIIIFNNTRIRNNTNGRDYVLKVGSDYINLLVLNNEFYFDMTVMQGKYQEQQFTSNGNALQTINVLTKGFDIEQNEIVVEINGEVQTKESHLYDMIPASKSYVVKTSFVKGVDIIFGNGSYGYVPPAGSIIKVKYLVSQGIDGNINNNKINDQDIVDEVYDGTGSLIQLTDLFDIFILNPINFGSDGESIEFTRTIAPMVSRNFVLAHPKNFYYYLARLGQFSYIDAYTLPNNKESDRTIYLYLIPELRNYISDGSNYFDLTDDVFYLDDYEKSKVMNYLTGVGTVIIGTNIQIIDTKLSRYVCFITLILFEGYDETQIRKIVIDSISSYFLGLSRRDRIPVTDLINIIEDIEGVDSVKLQFKSEKNEAYHIQGEQEMKRLQESKRNKATNVDIQSANYDKNKLLGLDPIMGDILFEKDEIPIMRGGQIDRDGNRYESGVVSKGFGAVNIYINPNRSKKLGGTI